MRRKLKITGFLFPVFGRRRRRKRRLIAWERLLADVLG